MKSPENSSSGSIGSGTMDRLAKLIDPHFYYYRNPDVAKAGMDAVTHFLNYGWKEKRDPNPYTILRFIENRHGEFNKLTELLDYLEQENYLNPLMRKPATKEQLYSVLESGDKDIEDVFNLNVAAYSSAQFDVLGEWPGHPVQHLFFDGLFQNRLRDGKFLDELILPVLNYENDYEFFANCEEPIEEPTFGDLKLTPLQDLETRHPLEGVNIGIGIVLYENTQIEIRRLIKSIEDNLSHVKFSSRLYIWDNSPAKMNLKWISANFPNLDVKITRSRKNVGFSIAHNKLMKLELSKGGDYYLGLNPDGFLLKHAISKVLTFAQSVAAPKIVEIDCEPLPHPKWHHPASGETDWVSGAAFLIDREAYRETGGFDEDFPMYCEDVDLSFRAMASGIGLFVSPFGRFYHDTSERIYTHEKWRTEKMLIGEWYLCTKWGATERARKVCNQLRRIGFDLGELPELPADLPEVSPEIQNLMEKERFSNSRFWAETCD